MAGVDIWFGSVPYSVLMTDGAIVYCFKRTGRLELSQWTC